jgi:signal transduction histidine kinase
MLQKKSQLEPGFLYLFRVYAWLRLLSVLVIPLGVLRTNFPGERPGLVTELDPSVDLTLPLVYMAINVIVLLIYLYWPLLQDRLGRFFPLGAILLASADLILGRQLLNISQFFEHIGAFFYILLILVAWQYSFKEVVYFTLGFTAVEGLLYVLFPAPELVVEAFEVEPRWIIIGLIFRTITFLVLGYVVTRLIKAQRGQRRELAEANQKLVRHAATLEQLTISRERIRLSRELHDTLAHTLSALAVQIDAVMTVWEPIPAQAREMLEGMLGATRSGLEETRRTLGALRASPLEEMGLALALRAMVEDFASRNGLYLDLEVPENLDDLPPEVEQCYFRVTQEVLENIDRHADASRLRVDMVHDSRGLVLKIEDNGGGFDVKNVSDYNGLGIKGIQERADLIGAELKLVSQPGQGTCMELYWEPDK